MPIRRYLDEQRFDAETVRLMGIAFESAVVAFQQKNADADAPRDAIAKVIIDLAQAGERDPDRLCDEALRELRLKGL